jgi:hypothetical protein
MQLHNGKKANMNTTEQRRREAIADLVSVSADARAAADRIDASISSEVDIAALKARVVQLDNLVTSLVHELEAVTTETPLTDEQANDFSLSLTASITGMSYRYMVSAYGQAYLKDCSKQKRVLICTVLLNAFKMQNLTPLDIWTSIVASDGHLN